jgi:hypothetical protein
MATKSIKVTLVRGMAIDPAVNKVAEGFFDNGHMLRKILSAHGGDFSHATLSIKDSNYCAECNEIASWDIAPLLITRRSNILTSLVLDLNHS